MKIKKWIKDHKKEIIVGIAAAGVTAVYFLKKDDHKKGNFEISFSFGDKDKSFLPYRGDDEYINLNLRDTKFTVKDLGVVGEELKNRISLLTDDTLIRNINANHSR